MKRLLITGSRSWTDYATIDAELAAVWHQWGRPSDIVLVSGGCPRGADRLCELVWGIKGWTVERHPVTAAEWAASRAAGFDRNARMVALGADACRAFIGPCQKPGCPESMPHGSHGARHCAGLAEAAGIDTYRVLSDPRLRV